MWVCAHVCLHVRVFAHVCVGGAVAVQHLYLSVKLLVAQRIHFQAHENYRYRVQGPSPEALVG